MNTTNELTHPDVIQSWSRPQLESAFTQREDQLQKAMEEIAELKQQLAQAQAAWSRPYPIQDGPSVPYWVMKPHEAWSQKNHGQSIDRIAERGGFGCSEAWCVVNGIGWFEMEKTIGHPEAKRRWIEFAAKINQNGWLSPDEARALVDGSNAEIDSLKKELELAATSSREAHNEVKALASQVVDYKKTCDQWENELCKAQKECEQWRRATGLQKPSGWLSPDEAKPLIEAREALQGRLGDDPKAIVWACEEYVAAEDALPDSFDSESYVFHEAVESLVAQADEAKRLEAESAAMRLVLKDAKPHRDEWMNQEAFENYKLCYEQALSTNAGADLLKELEFLRKFWRENSTSTGNESLKGTK